jgi:hypothetical protein
VAIAPSEVTDGELWLPTSKQAVVDMLVEALDDHASVVLVGEPGVGKTCVLRALRHRIPDVDREPRNSEPIAVTTARALVYDCERLLAGLYDYRSHLVAKPSRPPDRPDQLDWPF